MSFIHFFAKCFEEEIFKQIHLTSFNASVIQGFKYSERLVFVGNSYSDYVRALFDELNPLTYIWKLITVIVAIY